MSALETGPDSSTVPAMDSHEIIRKCFAKKSPKEISAELGVSLSLVYKWGETAESDGGSGAANPLDRTAQLVRLTGEPDILHWLCRVGNGYFVPDPDNAAHAGELSGSVNALVKHFAHTLGEVAGAAADHRITPAEAERLRAGWDQLRSRTESFIRACERGDFDAAKAPAAGN